MITKKEVENAIKDKRDFVRIDYLKRYLKENPPVDVKKYIYLKLSEVYEEKGLFSEAGDMFDKIAMLCFTYSDKIKNYVKAAEFYIKDLNFEKATEASRRALSNANSTQRREIISQITEFYKTEALKYEKQNKKRKAAKVYEKLLKTKIDKEEEQSVRDRLKELYTELGMFKERRMIWNNKTAKHLKKLFILN